MSQNWYNLSLSVGKKRCQVFKTSQPAKASAITLSQALKKSLLRSAKKGMFSKPTEISSSISKSKAVRHRKVVILIEKARAFPLSRSVIANQRNFNIFINRPKISQQGAVVEAQEGDQSMGRSEKRDLRKWSPVSTLHIEPLSKLSNQREHRWQIDVKSKDNRIIMKIWPN